MATLEVGRVCIKTAGREAGKYCVVLKKMDNTFFLVTGPKELTGVKRRRCNIEHLEPTPFTLKINAEASESVVIKAYEEIGLLKKFELKKPSPEVVKEAEKKAKKKVEEKPKKEEKKEKPKEKVKPEKKKEKVKIEEKKIEKKEEKPKEEKKEGIKLKIKIPSLRRAKKEEKPKKKAKPEKKVKKKPTKKAKKKK